jgi:TonB-linked SusC/RagA family outer membrane protein
MKQLKLLMLFVFLASFGVVQAQQKTISGTVKSKADGIPIPGVNVFIKGTSSGTQTDFDGKYSIQASSGDVLVFDYVGMKKIEKKVGSQSTVNILMEENVESLEEVLITAYGNTISEKKSTSSSVLLSKDRIENRPNINVLNSLEGQAAGVNISSFSGQPGTNKIDIVIRGVGSLSASTEPLFVIDGVPLTQAFYRNLNPNEIEDVRLLKDASATAIYGNRGANGVVVVTTKKGQYNQALSIGYSSSYGFTDFIGDNYNLGSAIDHLKLQRKGFDEGVNALASSFAITGSYLGDAVTLDPNNLEAFETNTDWQEEFFRQGITQTHDVNLSFGSENLKNYTNIGYLEQDGIVPTTGFQRFTLRNNFSGKSDNDKFEYGLNIFSAFSKRNQLEQETRSTGDTNINNNVLQNPLTGYLSSPRFLPLNLYQNGQQLLNDFGSPAFEIIPYMLIDLFQPLSAPSEFQETKTIANLTTSFKILDNLTFGINTGIDYAHERRVFAVGPEAYLSLVRASGAGTEFDGIETIQERREFMINHVNRLTFSDTFGKHNITASLFTEYVKAHRRTGFQQQIGLNPLTWSPGAGTGYIDWNPDLPLSYLPGVDAGDIDAGLFSYFGTADYDYDGRFGLSGTLRRDATYRFVEDNKWGTFWSIGGRYNISEEDYFESVNFVSDLKLRGSYGVTGNQNVIGRNADSSVSEIFLGSQIVRDLNASGTGYNNSPSFFVSSIANRELRWEETTQWNVGVDFGMFENRFTGTIDYYNRTTEGIYQTTPISAANGTYSISANDGTIRNQGIEFQGRYDILRDRKVKLSVFGNFAYNKDSYVDLGDVDDDNDGQFRPSDDFIRNEGGELLEYFLVPYAGVNPANGNLLFRDIDGNVTENITDEDRRSTSKSLFPTINGGFGFDLEYEGFFVNTLFNYVADIYRIDTNYEELMDIRNATFFPVSNDLFNAWTPENRSTDVPALAANNIDAGNTLSDRFLRDASFLRLRNITFGYNFQDKILEKTFIKSMTLRVIAENYLTFTKWKGLDPARSIGAEGLGFFPTPKILTFGLDVKF